jgi:CheY-like chemotaxis protein
MKKVLVIEDNKNIRENTAEILELSNYKVFTAEDGKEGVELAFTHRPDLIICDIIIPEIDGYNVLQIMQESEELKYVPFIFLTALAEQSEKRTGMELGARNYISKPFDLDDFWL